MCSRGRSRLLFSLGAASPPPSISLPLRVAARAHVRARAPFAYACAWLLYSAVGSPRPSNTSFVMG